MSSDDMLIKCTYCDYESKWKCNITRHMVRKHNIPKNENMSQMSTFLAVLTIYLKYQTITIILQRYVANAIKTFHVKIECKNT